MNPESIAKPIIEECNALREGTPVVLGLTSSELIQEQLQIRNEMKVKVREAKGKLDDVIDDLEAWKRTMSVALGYLTTDADKIQSYFWETLRQEKEATRSPRQP